MASYTAQINKYNKNNMVGKVGKVGKVPIQCLGRRETEKIVCVFE